MDDLLIRLADEATKTAMGIPDVDPNDAGDPPYIIIDHAITPTSDRYPECQEVEVYVEHSETRPDGIYNIQDVVTVQIDLQALFAGREAITTRTNDNHYYETRRVRF